MRTHSGLGTRLMPDTSYCKHTSNNAPFHQQLHKWFAASWSNRPAAPVWLHTQRTKQLSLYTHTITCTHNTHHTAHTIHHTHTHTHKTEAQVVCAHVVCVCVCVRLHCVRVLYAYVCVCGMCVCGVCECVHACVCACMCVACVWACACVCVIYDTHMLPRVVRLFQYNEPVTLLLSYLSKVYRRTQ